MSLDSKELSSTNPALVIGELGLLTNLAEAGIPVIIGCELEKSPVLHSRYATSQVLLPAYESRAFIDELCRLGEELPLKPVLFSDDDRAILNISRNRKRLESFYHLLYPDEEMVESILDKQRFDQLVSEYDLPGPKSSKASTAAELMKVAARIDYPCIIKPAQRHYWWGDSFIRSIGYYKKAIVCHSREELVALYEKISAIHPEVVIQEYVQGEDDQHYSSNFFVDARGTVRGYYIARKRRVYPCGAGTGTFIETVSNREVEEISFDIIGKLGLKGLLNIQFKRDQRTGEYKLMEIHARNSLWSRLGVKAGVNLASLYYHSLVKEQVSEEVLEARTGVKYINLSHDILAALEYRRARKLTIMEWLNSFRGERVFAMASIRDPLPTIYKMRMVLETRLKFSSIKNSGTERNG